MKGGAKKVNYGQSQVKPQHDAQCYHLIASRLEAIASMLEAIAFRLQAIAFRLKAVAPATSGWKQTPRTMRMRTKYSRSP